MAQVTSPAPMHTCEKHQKARIKFTPDEDQYLATLVARYGKNFQIISTQMVNRSERQCRERWNNYLDPSINKRSFTETEDSMLEYFVEKLGTQWSTIGCAFYGRTGGQLKNRYNYLQKIKMTSGERSSPITDQSPIKSKDDCWSLMENSPMEPKPQSPPIVQSPPVAFSTEIFGLSLQDDFLSDFEIHNIVPGLNDDMFGPCY